MKGDFQKKQWCHVSEKVKHKNLVSIKWMWVKFPRWRDNQADVSSIGPSSFALTKS